MCCCSGLSLDPPLRAPEGKAKHSFSYHFLHHNNLACLPSANYNRPRFWIRGSSGASCDALRSFPLRCSDTDTYHGMLREVGFFRLSLSNCAPNTQIIVWHLSTYCGTIVSHNHLTIYSRERKHIFANVFPRSPTTISSSKSEALAPFNSLSTILVST